MKALAVFHDHGNHILDPLLKAGFRHCFAAIASEEVWIRIDGQVGCPVFEVVAQASFDLATFYRAEGFTVIETEQRSTPTRWPLTLTNCVGLVKTVLCINAALVVTPWRLYLYMTRPSGSWLPGSSRFRPAQPGVTRGQFSQSLIKAFSGGRLNVPQSRFDGAQSQSGGGSAGATAGDDRTALETALGQKPLSQRDPFIADFAQRNPASAPQRGPGTDSFIASFKERGLGASQGGGKKARPRRRAHLLQAPLAGPSTKLGG